MHRRRYCACEFKTYDAFSLLNISGAAINHQIYDTATGQRVPTLHDFNNTNNYSKNLASFNPTDDLVLSEGVLWDVKGKQVIHKFDKFSNFVSGVFQPSGLEIIINSEIVSFSCFYRTSQCYTVKQWVHITFYENNGTQRPFTDLEKLLPPSSYFDSELGEIDIKDYYFIKKSLLFPHLERFRESLHSHLTDPPSINLFLNILGDLPANLRHQPSR